MVATATRLVGRRAELDRLAALVEEARRGGGRIAVVDGEPGIGKTRLVDEVAGIAAERGFRTLRAAGEELERERPFGLVADALRLGRAGDRERTAIAALLQTPQSESADLRFQLVERISDLVEHELERGPLLLVAEDVHWADPSSLLTLFRLSRRIAFRPAFLLLTCRPVPRSPELRRLLRAVADAGALELRLDPLTPDAVVELASGLVGREPRASLLDELRRAGGNPLFVCELTAALMAADAVDVHEGRPEAGQPTSAARSLRLTILSRLTSLGEDSVEALRLASVLGGSFTADDLAELTGWAPVEVLSRLREPLQGGFLLDEDGRLTFRHDVVREALYLDVSPALRASLHRQAARALAAAGRPARQVAVHFSLGAAPGDAEAVAWLAKAGREIIGHAPSLALELFDRALDLTSAHDAVRTELRADSIRPLVWTGQLSRAEEVARELLAEVRDAGVTAGAGAALSAVLFLQYRLEDLQQLCDEMLSRELGGAYRLHFSAMAVMPAVAAGEFDRAVALAEQAAEAGTDLGPIAAVPVANTLGIVARLEGRFSEAVDVGGRAVEAAHEALDVDVPPVSPRQVLGNALVFQSWNLLAADRLDEAAALLRAAMREYERIGAVAYVNLCHRGLANVAATSGAWDDARVELEIIRQLEEETQAHGLDTHQPDPSLLLALHAGRLADAQRILRELEDALPAERWRRANSWFVPMKAEFLAAVGDDRSALAVLDDHCSAAEDVGAVPEYRLFGATLVRLALALGRREVAERAAAGAAELARRAGDVPTTNGVALLCRGLLEDDADLLTSAVDAYRAGRRPLELAVACEERALALERGGDRTGAVRSLDEALETFVRLGAVRDASRLRQRLRGLGVRRAAGGPRSKERHGWESLTPSELRVVELLTQGLSNPEIAERLYVSRRTVRAHLESVFRKLQVTSRAELAGRAVRRGAR